MAELCARAPDRCRRARSRSQASRSTRASSPSGDLFVGGRRGPATTSRTALAARRRRRARARTTRFAALAALGGVVRDRSARTRRRHHRLRGQDVDEGHPGRDLPTPRRARWPPRTASTTRSACRSRSAGSSPTPRSASSSWPCAGLGQIAELCAFARPEVGVITNVGAAHVELLGLARRDRREGEVRARRSAAAAAAWRSSRTGSRS